MSFTALNSDNCGTANAPEQRTGSTYAARVSTARLMLADRRNRQLVISGERAGLATTYKAYTQEDIRGRLGRPSFPAGEKNKTFLGQGRSRPERTSTHQGCSTTWFCLGYIVLQKTIEDKNTANLTVTRLEVEKQQQQQELKKLKEETKKLKERLGKSESEQRQTKKELTSKAKECNQLRIQLAASETQATKRSADVKKLLADFSSQIDMASLPQAAAAST
ncbi:unnamed protein product [Cyclocybe aegerita]|uniref:Uncharacterized protein n=1 Tax=Cyclocybe aegerita TaxID=1973307 RepID=A0A8S0VWG2_CYCAE|nr:unnamed protein product [Cyclocybe aegerita]